MTRWRTRALIFDFNGTLSDDEPILCEIFGRLFAEHGRPMSAQEYFDELAGLSDPEIVRTWLGHDHPDVDAVIAERVERVPRRRSQTARRCTSTRARRVRYAAERVPLAICSGAVRAEIEPVVEAAGIAPLLQAIVSSDDVTEGKPHPEGYLKALASLGADAAEHHRLRGHRGGNRVGTGGGRRARARGARNARAAAASRAADELIDRIDVDVMRRLLG